MKKSASSLRNAREIIFIQLALAFFVFAGISSWRIIAHTQASTDAIEKILTTYNMKNEGEQALERFDQKNPLIALFAAPIAKKTLKLPSQEQAEDALTADVIAGKKEVRQQSSIAAWWSWSLVSVSVVYVVLIVVLERRHNTRPVLFALTSVSLVFFIIGVLAPAMVIWTAPNIHLATGDLSFVVQHQVRGIAAIIWELLTAGHGIVGGFLLLFSIVTPLMKASLTYVALGSSNQDFNHKIGQFLHTIGKWSMADVFVAAILLALYALKFQQATRSIPCLGLYYFIGYCLVALGTTQLLVGSEVTGEKRSKTQIGLGAIGGLLAAMVCFLAASGLYTFEQYTENTKQRLTPGSPQKLNNSDFVLPAHK